MKHLLPFSLFVIVLVAVCGCSTPCSPLDATQGWRRLMSQEHEALDRVIKDDYQAYIQGLPPKQRRYVGTIWTFGNGRGEYAVTIELSLDGTNWKHVLFYDRAHQRTRSLKYVSGHYRS